MATWPSASKAPTTNLDSGTDSPAAARADIKTNVDNVNSIIDMFNITSPSNNQILKYNTSNSRFELAADADTDTNTTYAISAETATGGVNLRLTGSDASTDDVKLAQGSNITLTRTDANTVTIASADQYTGTVTSVAGTGTVNGLSLSGTVTSSGSLTLSGTLDLSSPPAIGGSTPAAGAFTTLSAATTTLDDIRETVYTGGATTGTITPDCANGSIQKITLTGSITFNAFANPIAGQSMTLIVMQSSGGNNTLTSTMKFSGGSKTLSTAGNSIDIISVFYDGSTYYASLGKGFA